MIINVKNSERLELPKRATPKSAAYDVFAVGEPEIVGEKSGEAWKRIDYIQYRTSLYTAPQKDNYQNDYHILIHPRSSVSKYNLVLANGIGLVDSDYRGEMLVRYKYIWQPEDLIWAADVISENEEGKTMKKVILGFVNTERIYKAGDRVAQLVAEPTVEAEWVRVENLDETVRGAGAFGSTTIPITNKVVAEEKPKTPQKSYESKVDLVDQWKKFGGSVGHTPNYETLVKEREKQIG